MVLGWDVAGTVVAAGSQVNAWRAGDRVAAMVFQPLDQRGTYARYINLDAGHLARVPDGLSLEHAATIPLAGLTAAQLLDAVNDLLERGVTLTVERGVTLTVELGEFTAAVRQHYPDGVDAALDLVGGRAAHAAFNSVRDGGRYQTSLPPYIDATGQFDTERRIPAHVLVVHANRQQLTTLLNLAADGALPTTVEATCPLEQAADAHRRQAAGQLIGLVLLLP